MTTYITRVELHGADRNDYQKLDAEMKKEAFTSNKSNFPANQAEFSYQGSQPIQNVIDAVLRAAEKTGRKFSFTVMKDKILDKPESKKRLQQV